MNIINASYEILTPIDGKQELKFIEKIGRTCYKSEDKISEDETSAIIFVRNLIKHGHEAMLEHSSFTVKFVCDRGISHEIVRHRLCSFAQESTRYCNYSKDKFGGVTFIKPLYLNNDEYRYAIWQEECRAAEEAYMNMLNDGATPQEARAVLPTSVKTELVVTANYREWRNIFKLRCAKDAHPQIRELMIPLCNELKEKLPVVFEDIKW